MVAIIYLCILDGVELKEFLSRYFHRNGNSGTEQGKTNAQNAKWLRERERGEMKRFGEFGPKILLNTSDVHERIKINNNENNEQIANHRHQPPSPSKMCEKLS